MAEDKKIATGCIGNALRSSAADHTTTFADEIFDTERQKYQNEVNADIETKIAAEIARAKAAEEAIIYDVSSHNDGAVFESLSALLSSDNLSTLIPTSVRHGGMTIRFIQGSEQSSDNKYVQYRLMSDLFNTTLTDWQGVDIDVTYNDNLVTGKGVINSISRVYPKMSYIGQGTGLIYVESNRINNLMPNRTYRVLIKDPHSLDEITGTSPKLQFFVENDNDEAKLVIQVPANKVIADYYDITIPNGYNKLYLEGRAPLNYEFVTYIKDVTSMTVTGKGNEYVISKDIYQSVILDKYGLYRHEILLNDKMFLSSKLMELGNIQFYDNPPSYSDSNSRVRTKRGHTIFLRTGDIISFAGKKMYISYFDENGEFHFLNDWKSDGYIIPNDGFYALLFRYSTEASITESVDEFLSNVYIYNPKSTSYLTNKIANIHPITNFSIRGVLTASGVVVLNDYWCTDYINVIPNKIYRIVTASLGSSAYFNVAYYHSYDGINFTYISNENNNGGVKYLLTPNNANYVRLTTCKPNGFDNISEGIFEPIDYVKQFGDFDFYSHIHQPDNQIWSNAVMSASEYNNGNTLTNTYYYSIAGIKKVGFNINSETTFKVFLGFYDQNFKFISKVSVVSSNPVFSIPTNVTYIKITLIKIIDGTETKTTPEDVTYGMITVDYSNVEREGSDATSGLVRYFGNTKDNVEKYLQEVYENFAGITEVSLGKTTGYSIQYSNGNYTVKEGYTITDPIFIKKGVTITYRTYTANENWSCFAVFDSGMIYKKDISARNDISMEFHTFTAPYDCYIRISCDTSYLSKLYFRYSNVSDSISNRLKALETVVFNDYMPDYWIEYLNNKQASINAGLTSVGTHGDIFIFFSDYHAVVNECKSPIVMKYICERYNINKIVFGGDVLNTHNSKEISLDLLETFMKSFSFTSIYNVLGNHDNNPYGGSSNVLNEDEYYPILFKHLENKVHMNRGCYYYYENEFQKIRYIVLNTHDNGFNLSSADDIAQLNWFCATLNSVQEGWYVVVITHMYYEVYENQETHLHYVDVSAGNLIYPITDAYNSKSSGSMSNDGVIYSFDFTSANGKIACLLVGHVHSDYSEMRLSGTVNSYPIISIEQDSTYYTGSIETDPTRTAGTYSEQAFDIVCIDTENKNIKTVRIGAGEDRNFIFNRVE